jgi:hypothetical protein
LHSNSCYEGEIFNPCMDPKRFVQPRLIRTLKLQLTNDTPLIGQGDSKVYRMFMKTK